MFFTYGTWSRFRLSSAYHLKKIQDFLKLPNLWYLSGNEAKNIEVVSECYILGYSMPDKKYPVVIGNGRCMTRDNVIAGYEIPKGVQIVFQHYAISNSDKYFEDADKFKPERWLKNTETNQAKDLLNELRSGGGCQKKEAEKVQFHPFASLPFGYGRRMCLGRRFAELEIQTVIAKIIQNFRIEYHYGELDYHINTMYTPNGPLKFRMIDRK